MTTSSLKICVVDDDPSICKALRRLLKSAGYDVSVFASAEAFLGAGPPPPPGVLIIDLRMPGMSGLELQASLAASGQARPIVFITAHEDEAARKNALAAGALAFFQKPFDEKGLLGVIQGAFHPRTG